MKRAKIFVTVKIYPCCLLSTQPFDHDLQIFDSKRAKTLFAQWTTFFILVASNLHSAEGLKRLRDVRLFNEMTQERDLNATTSHSAATCFFMVLRLWVVRRAKRNCSTWLSPLQWTLQAGHQQKRFAWSISSIIHLNGKVQNPIQSLNCAYMRTFFHYNLYQAAAQRWQRSCPGTSWNMPLSQGTHDNEAPETWLVPSEGQRQTVGMYGRSWIIWFTLITWCPLQSEDASHYQDYDTSRKGDPKFNLRLPLLLSGGASQPMSCCVSSNKMFGRMIQVKYCLFCTPEGHQSSWQRPIVCTDPSSTRKKPWKGKVLSENHSCCPTRLGISPAFYASLQKLRKVPASNNAAKKTFPDSDHKRWFWTRTKNDIRRHSIRSIHSVFHSQNLDPAWCTGLTNVCHTLVVRQLLGIGSTRAWSTPRN